MFEPSAGVPKTARTADDLALKPVMRFEGTIESWNDDRGFGFIAPDKGDEHVFFHIKSYRSRSGRPQVGQRVAFEVEMGPEGRKRAKGVEEIRLPSGVRAERDRGMAQWGTATLLAILAFLVVFLAASLAWRVPAWIAGLYVGASAVAFVLYWLDKYAARSGAWRIPETWLLAAGVVGGWPGALVAQQVLRHKSIKRSFRTVFWATVVVNFAAFLLLASPLGERLLRG